MGGGAPLTGLQAKSSGSRAPSASKERAWAICGQLSRSL
ncbi:uncharacterized protein G2W53_014124 [Senna tora]|uniref:Uncharacterized protein n=1 Tax=Senna tora TaxID=362788 RepID=A0A835C255_9FABA|nr:uncharacterized protein G2W53_014124 [Senna tora]